MEVGLRVNFIFHPVRILLSTNGHIIEALIKATMGGSGRGLLRVYKDTPELRQVHSSPEQIECVSIHSGSSTLNTVKFGPQS